MTSFVVRAGLAAFAGLALVSETAAGGKPVACYEQVAHPAVYRTVEERVLLRPASAITVVRPATYGTRTRLVEVEPERVVERITPGVVKTVHRKVKVKPAGHVWKWKRIDGRKVLCKIEHPPVWTTVAETVEIKPERVEHVVLAAQYERIAESFVIEPERHERIETPAEYGVVRTRVLVSEGGTSWRKVKLPKHCR